MLPNRQTAEYAGNGTIYTKLTMPFFFVSLVPFVVKKEGILTTKDTKNTKDLSTKKRYVIFRRKPITDTPVIFYPLLSLFSLPFSFVRIRVGVRVF